MRASLHLLQWLLACALLVLGWNLKDPHLLPVRHLETPVLLILAALGLLLALRRPPRRNRALLPGAFLAAIALTVAGEWTLQYRKREVLRTEPALAASLGRHFVVGYSAPDDLWPLVSRGLVGGIFVTQRNAAGKSHDELRREIGELQVLRRVAGLPPLLVATDQEGGPVSRLSPPLEKLPGLAALVAASRSEEELARKAEAYGARQGEALAGLGVTVNLSPVVDLRAEDGHRALDFHSRIGSRAISSDPYVTARVAEAYGRGLESKGVKPTLKHFPGLGRVTGDTHHFSAVLGTPIAELQSRDWLPFRQVATHSSSLIMLGHVILAELDRDNPVSFSRAAVQTIVRGEWRHDGLLITDDLTMAAAYDRGLCAATVKALNAGVDLLLVSYDHEKYYDAMYCATRAYNDGRLDRVLLDGSRRRLVRLAPDVR